MRTCAWALILLVAFGPSVGAAPDRAEQAYQGARRGYYALKDDARRRKLRHNWLNVAHRFEAVARRYPKSPRAPDALYTAADLLQELSRFSMLDDDRAAAAKNFELLVSDFPTHRLADDAALALARFELEQRGRPNRAREVLSSALEKLPKGDRARELKSLLARIPADDRLKSSTRQIAARSGAEKASREEALAEAFARGAQAAEVAEPVLPAEKLEESEEDAKKIATLIGSGSGDEGGSVPAAQGDAKPEPAPSSTPSSTLAQTGVDKALPASEPASVTSQTAATTRPSGAAEPVRGEGVSPESLPVLAQSETKRPSRAERDDARRALKEAARIREREVTLAEQLGLKVRRVVIDPGHGGHDSGAIGRKGTMEKDVSLSVSRKLAELLADAGFEVVLTRDEDTFVRLEDRARIANEFKGDLFISVHCNSATNRKLRGVETYTLNIAADRYSIRLAARENSSSEKGMNDLQFILADLATKANTEESSRLASRVQKALVGGLSSKYGGIKDLGTKQALFYVLLGVRMPAILVETSFLSHPEEEARLASGEYQSEIARSIAAGIQDFLGSRLARAR